MDPSDLEHEIVYFAGPMPGRLDLPRQFVLGCPEQVQAKMFRILVEVAKAPPKRFAGGGYWEAMSGDMRGWHELRADYRGIHYRLFCRIDYEASGIEHPLLVIVAGLSKKFGTVISPEVYELIREAGEIYFATNPRALA